MMDFDDTLKFFNRIGVRIVNDVTAHVTAKVTTAMDPEGMGAHAGPLPLAPVHEMATKDELKVVVADISNALVTVSKTVHDSALNVIVHKVGEMKQSVDDKVADIDDKMTDIDNKMTDIDDKMTDIDDKVANFDYQVANLKSQFEKRLASLETHKKSQKKPESKTRSTVFRNIAFANGNYSWRKTIREKVGYKGSYKTIAAAQQGLANFCQEQQAHGAKLMEDRVACVSISLACVHFLLKV